MRLVVLAVLLATTSCHAKHECQNPKEITEDFTPVFDFNENWSFNDCGTWSNREVAAPWRIAVSRTDGATCFGILLSDYDFITSECKEVADNFHKEPSNVKAYTGKCYDHKAVSTDAISAECTGLEVNKSVAVLGKDSGETQLHLWRLKVAAPGTTPICMFISSRKQDGGYGVTEDYQIFDRNWKEHIAARVGGTPSSSQSSEICVKFSHVQPTEEEHDFYGDFLVKEVRGRVTLRGFFFWPVAQHKIFVYTDVVPFIEELVDESHNLYLMPQVQPAKMKTDFKEAPTLNKKGECGIVMATAETSKSSIPGLHNEALRGAHPWHASISYRPKDLNETSSRFDFCGATLISKWAVLTAARCVISKGQYYIASDLQIALGMYDATEINGTEQFIRVERIVRYPFYRLALLFLKKEVTVTSYVRPICLWDDDYSLEIIKGKNGTVVGWGNNEDIDGFYWRMEWTNTLQEGQVSVLDHKDCYSQEKVFYRKYLNPGANFCAGGVRAGAQSHSFRLVPSFSGGGLVFRKDNAWYLRGVVSNCVAKIIYPDGEKITTINDDYPLLFVDLGCCMDWIVQQVAHYVPLAPTNQ